jgi:hypothetical protein
MTRRPCPTLASGGIAMLAAAAAASLPLPAAGAACAARSGEHTVALVELYTSEGCSSCPPADRWLAATFGDAAAAAHAVPLAFHVDYWDRLGWKDRFATAAYTERQYAGMRANGERFVYTPQVLVQGRDHPGWHALSLGAGGAVAAANATPARAGIALEVAPQPGGTLAVEARVQVPAAADRKGATTYVALVESGLASEVRAGENAGARLAHDHVVREFRAGAAADASGAATTDVVLEWPDEAGTAATVVAFVQNPGTGEVLQALALPLAGCGVKR